MTPEQTAQLQPHLDATAKILYEDSDPATMQTLEDIELRVREQIQAHVSPELGRFLSAQLAARRSAENETLKSTLGELVLTSAQADRLSVGAYRQISPHLENCCLRISANVSYAQACEDVSYLTGLRVPAKTQQPLVQSHDFAQPELSVLEEVSVDGGMRLRTPVGEPCQWKDYKAVASEAAIVACYQQNDELAEWVNQQPLATPLTCLGRRAWWGLESGGPDGC